MPGPSPPPSLPCPQPPRVRRVVPLALLLLAGFTGAAVADPAGYSVATCGSAGDTELPEGDMTVGETEVNNPSLGKIENDGVSIRILDGGRVCVTHGAHGPDVPVQSIHVPISVSGLDNDITIGG